MERNESKTANELFAEVLDDLGFSIQKMPEGGYAIWDEQLSAYRVDGLDGDLIIAHNAGEVLEELTTYVEDSFNRDLEEEFENYGLNAWYEMPETLEDWVHLAELFEIRNADDPEKDFLAAHQDELELCDLIANRYSEVDLDEVLFEKFCRETYEKIDALGAGESYATFDFPCDGMKICYEKDSAYDKGKDPDLYNIVSLRFEYRGRNIGVSFDEHVNDLSLRAIKDGSYDNLIDEGRTLGELIMQNSDTSKAAGKHCKDGREL